MKTVLILIIIVLIQGCAGVNLSVLGEHKPNQIELASEPGNVSGLFIKDEKTYTKSSVTELWGTPDKIVTSKDGETWMYERGVKWRGAVAWFLIPIPLAIPVGNNYALLNFKDDSLEEVVEQYNRTPFLGCTPLEGRYHCGKIYNSF
jgi:hypothetical protein